MVEQGRAVASWATQTEQDGADMAGTSSVLYSPPSIGPPNAVGSARTQGRQNWGTQFTSDMTQTVVGPKPTSGAFGISGKEVRSSILR